jgi:uncharacterized damage-inducible protein DinB
VEPGRHAPLLPPQRRRAEAAGRPEVRSRYAADLAGREPIASLAEAASIIHDVCSPFDAARWARSYAPGKWTARQILVHLAQIEMVFGVRVRFALSTGAYVVQPFDQDPFIEVEGTLIDGTTALASFLAQRAMNLQLFRKLTPAQLATQFHHPERGRMTVAELIAYLAGHDWRHVGQLRQI